MTEQNEQPTDETIEDPLADPADDEIARLTA